MFLGDEHVKRWHDEECEDCSNRHTANEHETDGISCRGPGTGYEGEREVAGDSRDAGHHDWPQSNSGGLRYGRNFRQTLTLELICKLDNENTIFGYKTNQSH